jgi:hypothetical protein
MSVPSIYPYLISELLDSDAEGGHSPFPLASDAFAEKLQRFYDERV